MNDESGWLWKEKEETEVQKRDRGMAIAADNNDDILSVAKKCAFIHAVRNGVVTIEDVRAALDKVLGTGWPKGNWMGSVFKGRLWKWTGRMVQTKHKGGHARAVREWRLRQ